MKIYHVEIRGEKSCREIFADGWRENDRWMIFYLNPPEGGTREHLRFQRSEVISIETQP